MMAYDSSRAYRLIEALRNLVQHREMPSLTFNRTERLDPATGQKTTKVTYNFPVSDLLTSPKCPATIKKEFHETPNLEIDLPDTVDQAMMAINPVLVEWVKTSTPELAACIILLRKVFAESSGTPLLLRLKPPLARSRLIETNLEMIPLHDLQYLVQNFPISNDPAQEGESI